MMNLMEIHVNLMRSVPFFLLSYIRFIDYAIFRIFMKNCVILRHQGRYTWYRIFSHGINFFVNSFANFSFREILEIAILNLSEKSGNHILIHRVHFDI